MPVENGVRVKHIYEGNGRRRSNTFGTKRLPRLPKKDSDVVIGLSHTSILGRLVINLIKRRKARKTVITQATGRGLSASRLWAP